MARTLPTRATSRAEVARRYVPIPTGDGRESLRVPLRARGARKRSARARHRGPRSIPISILNTVPVTNTVPVIARSVATKQSRKQQRLLRFARNDRGIYNTPPPFPPPRCGGGLGWGRYWAVVFVFVVVGPRGASRAPELSRGVYASAGRARAALFAAGEFASVPGKRGAQGTASLFEAASDRVAFLFGYFFFGEAKKK